MSNSRLKADITLKTHDRSLYILRRFFDYVLTTYITFNTYHWMVMVTMGSWNYLPHVSFKNYVNFGFVQ